MNLLTEKTARELLPNTIASGKPLATKLKYLIMAPPKWGKTTFFTGIPNSLLLAFEEGHQFTECFKVVITAWDLPMKSRGGMIDEQNITYASAMEILEALEVYNPYEFIIIDTTDVAVKMCADYECKKAGLSHPSDGGDYGKGWDLYQTNPFRKYYNRLVKLGVGVAVTTHVKEEWKENKFKQLEFRRETSLPGGIQKFVHAQSDIIINGMFGRRRKGLRDRDRIISFDGTNEIMAGTRIRGVYVPNKYIVQPPTNTYPHAPWDQWQGFFSMSPTAGEEAERFYLDTIAGKDSEAEAEKLEPTEDKNGEPTITKTQKQNGINTKNTTTTNTTSTSKR